jgi:hypothetical protein
VGTQRNKHKNRRYSALDAFFIKLNFIINNILNKVKNVFNKKGVLFNLLPELNYNILNITNLLNNKD